MKDIDWRAVYEYAKKVVNPNKISAHICSGGVGAAVVTKKGNIYRCMYRY